MRAPGERETEAERPSRQVGHHRDVARLGHDGRPPRRLAQVVGMDPGLEGADHQHVAAREVDAEPRYGRLRVDGIARPGAVGLDGSPPQRNRLLEGAVALALDQRRSTGVDVDVDQVGNRGEPDALRDEALLGGRVDHELPRGDPGRGRHVERVVGQRLDHATEAVRHREVELDARVERAAPPGVRLCERRAPERPGWRERLGRPDPHRRVAQPVDLGRQLGPAGEQRLDRGRLVGLARVQRVRAEEVLELRVGKLATARHRPCPSDSSAAAMRRRPSRSRDLAVPSGIPSTSAT